MALFLNSCFRLMQLRRRHAVIGLLICFAICLFIYSAIPTRHHNDLHRMAFPHSNSDTKPHEMDQLNPRIKVKGLRFDHEKEVAQAKVFVAKKTDTDMLAAGLKKRDPSVQVSAVKKVDSGMLVAGRKKTSSSPEALASKSKLGGGGDVFSGNLGQVVLVPFAFNVSAERVIRLQENTMLFRQLQQQVRNTRAYLASVQPDFDVNAGACRCGRSISMECSCCAKLTMKRFLMEHPACVNFTYVLKDHVLRVRLNYDKKQIAERTLAAATPPMLCAGAAVDLCAAFRNVTYKVQLDSVDHKTALSGCLDLIMRLKARPIAIYPMGCFHLGRDPKLVHIDKLNNWMP